MNKNLEELEEIKEDYIKRDSPRKVFMDIEDALNISKVMRTTIKILKDFEKRLDKLEGEREGLRPRIRLIKSPELIKSGHGLRPKTKRPRPKPRPKIIYNYKMGGTDPD